MLYEGKQVWIKNMEKNMVKDIESIQNKKKRKNEENDEKINNKKAKVNKNVVLDFMKSNGFL